MQLKTILNRVQKFKSFVYGSVRWVESAGAPMIEAELHPRRGSRPVCSGCCRKRLGYDTLALRRFEFISRWDVKVFFLYALRRVDCPACGLRVERMPWAEGKHRLTEAYAWFLAGWARRLSWTAARQAACECFRPILLTSITTIAGLMPLLLETSLQAQILIPWRPVSPLA
jgi:transposase